MSSSALCKCGAFLQDACDCALRPKLYLQDPDCSLYCGDVLETLWSMPDESVDSVVTSPPYWSLRDYGVDGQIGNEDTPEEYVHKLIEVFSEVRRVLANHGTLWLNLGDVHYEKQVLGLPWQVAFGLQADGWVFRSEVVWSKPSVMPESVTDRPTRSHEYLFLFTRSFDYYWDQEAVREPTKSLDPSESSYRPNSVAISEAGRKEFSAKNEMSARAYNPAGRNLRSVWTIAPEPYKGAHFAVMPTALVERCLKAGCPTHVCRWCAAPRRRLVSRTSLDRNEIPREHPEWRPRRYDGGKAGSSESPGPGQRFTSTETVGWACECGHGDYRAGIVLDPFGGSGTTALVARKLGLRSILVELNPAYCDLAANRLAQQSLLAEAM